MSDLVNHPKHYNQGGIECWDVEEMIFGKDILALNCIINAFEYLWRHKEKNGKQDIEKAIAYLNKYIELIGGCDDKKN